MLQFFEPRQRKRQKGQKAMKVNRFVSNDFTIRLGAVDATSVVAEMQSILKSAPLATVGVGRAMVGALLMASQLKDGQEVGLLLKGNGPLGSLYAQASFEGHVRGYCPYPDYMAQTVEDALNLRKALGFGHLTVSRQQPFQRQPHNGTVEMVSGEVGEDIAHYLHQSHQIRSLVSVGVLLDRDGRVQSAGGVLLEVMPGVEEDVVAKVEKNYAEFQKLSSESISQSILAGKQPIDLVKPFMMDIPFTQIPHDYEIKYSCPCTLDRVIQAVGTLGMSDLEEMIQQNESPEVTCQMCGRGYAVTTEDLKDLRDVLHKNSMH